MPLDLVVHIEPPSPERPWSAVLENPQTGQRIPCASPLELLRNLEQLCRETGGQVFGIR